MSKQMEYKSLLRETIRQVKGNELVKTEQLYEKLKSELENLYDKPSKKDKVRQ